MVSLDAKMAALIARVGVLAPTASVALLFGAIVHQTGMASMSYTWLRPYRVLVDMLGISWMPTALALVYGIGVFSRRGSHQALAEARLFVRRTWLLIGRSPLMAACALVGVGLDFVIFHRHAISDRIVSAVVAIAAYEVAARRWHRSETSRSLAYLCLTAFTFSAVCYWFTVTKSLVFANAAPVDAKLAAFERQIFGRDPYRLVAAWAAGHPHWVHWFDWAYFKIFDHMTLVAAFLFGLGNRRLRNEYFGALAICYLLGGPLYWLCPALGPVYFDPASFHFLREQTLVVNYMQPHLMANTMAVDAGHGRILETWSYIACMPSLHMAHEAVMLYYVRTSRLAWWVSLAFSTFTAAAVVALGWHYPSDILAGLVLASFSILLARWKSERLLPTVDYGHTSA